jgi:glycosyltransferase 2 family protein
LKSRRWILWVIVAGALVVCALIARSRVHFEWHVFTQQLKLADWRLIGLGIALIWSAYGVRAIRWSMLLRPTKKVAPWKLVGSQVIGFTAVAIFGRLADLVRPYLVSRRTEFPLSSQIAVYTVERTFDFGTVALIFSTVLLFAKDRHLLPRPELIHKAAMGGLLATAAMGLFAVAARVSGRVVASMAGRILGLISPSLGENVREKILEFHDGLNAIGSPADFLVVVGLSLLHWLMITYAYLETARAFVASPPLAGMTLAPCMLLMAASMGSSLLQLPVLGWFTQIALTAAAIKELFHVAPEPALGCGSVLLLVTFLSVIPLGLAWARIEHVSLKKISEESGRAGAHAGTDALTPPEPVR